ncbi:hypothetical protein MHO82_09680 [Vibrio sp. Of7-15]|uniref:hypothetical protein n=1 Tax=Vibrio sp. Of7-15 TaxID=2724879 RepID=UPI001EF38168|nr:hypothetical protein [Vibrio sp. Of7-15]MCG7497137.1 hypothetical protein [Vibrio sp. Of7-15]
MKTSELIQKLTEISKLSPNDCEVVTGEEWFPEQLLEASHQDPHVFLHFDSPPVDMPREVDARGFIDHEVDLVKKSITDIVLSQQEPEQIIEKLTELLIFSHEHISADVIERLSELDEN